MILIKQNKEATRQISDKQKVIEQEETGRESGMERSPFGTGPMSPDPSQQKNEKKTEGPPLSVYSVGRHRLLALPILQLSNHPYGARCPLLMYSVV